MEFNFSKMITDKRSQKKIGLFNNAYFPLALFYLQVFGFQL